MLQLATSPRFSCGACVNGSRQPWLRSMASAVGVPAEGMVAALPALGCEWSDQASLDSVLAAFVMVRTLRGGRGPLHPPLTQGPTRLVVGLRGLGAG